MASPAAEAQLFHRMPEATIDPALGEDHLLGSLATKVGVALAVALACIGALAPLTFALVFAVAPGGFLW